MLTADVAIKLLLLGMVVLAGGTAVTVRDFWLDNKSLRYQRDHWKAEAERFHAMVVGGKQ